MRCYIDIAEFRQVKRMTVAALETSLYQSQIFSTDRAGKDTSRSKALEFGFEVCIHSLSVSKEANESNFRMIVIELNSSIITFKVPKLKLLLYLNLLYNNI